jgi:hypothetical protein
MNEPQECVSVSYIRSGLSWSHPSSYEGYAARSAALERLAMAYAVLRHVAAGALGIALVSGWHSADIANF